MVTKHMYSNCMYNSLLVNVFVSLIVSEVLPHMITKKTKRNKVGGHGNNIEEPHGDRIDPEVCGIDIEESQVDRIDAEVCGIDIEDPQGNRFDTKFMALM